MSHDLSSLSRKGNNQDRIFRNMGIATFGAPGAMMVSSLNRGSAVFMRVGREDVFGAGGGKDGKKALRPKKWRQGQESVAWSFPSKQKNNLTASAGKSGRC
jgi:hypothetical protein